MNHSAQQTQRAPLLLAPLRPISVLRLWISESGIDAGQPTRCTPNLPTKTIPAKICWLELSGKFPLGVGIPPLEIDIPLESDPLNPDSEVGDRPSVRAKGRRRVARLERRRLRGGSTTPPPREGGACKISCCLHRS